MVFGPSVSPIYPVPIGAYGAAATPAAATAAAGVGAGNPMANNPAVAAAALQRQVQAQVQAAAFQAAAQGASAAALWGTQQTRGRSDRVEVCREFRRGFCTRNVSECRFAHPSDNVNISEEGSVTICMDHEKGRCARDPCRYFHRPDHMKTTSSSSNKSTQNSLHSSLTNTFNIHPPGGGGSTSAAQQQQIAYQQQIAVAALCNWRGWGLRSRRWSSHKLVSRPKLQLTSGLTQDNLTLIVWECSDLHTTPPIFSTFFQTSPGSPIRTSVTNTFNIHPPGGGGSTSAAAQQQQIAYQQQIAVAALCNWRGWGLRSRRWSSHKLVSRPKLQLTSGLTQDNLTLIVWECSDLHTTPPIFSIFFLSNKSRQSIST